MFRSFLCLILLWSLSSFAAADSTWYEVKDCGAACNSNVVGSTKAEACNDDYPYPAGFPYCDAGTETITDPPHLDGSQWCTFSYECWDGSIKRTGGATQDFWVYTCADDEKWDGNNCVSTIPDCSDPQYPQGSSYDSTLEQCLCPEGQTDYLDPNGGFYCTEPLDDCTPSSPNFTGAWVNETPICSYNSCPEGQNGGMVDLGNGPEWACVEDNQCVGTWINGSCIAPEDTTPEPDTHTDKDTDGDGVPDSSDSDMDGDGIPNSTDDDIDGDGVPNADDMTNEKESSASGGGSCESAPVCQGDAVQCAILQQQWLTRCSSEDEGKFEDNGCEVDPLCEGDPLLCAAVIYSWRDDCAIEKAKVDAESYFENNSYQEAEDIAASGGPFLDGGETDLGDIVDGALSARSTVAASCPASETANLGPFGQWEVSYQPFCDLADMIYWVVMLSAYLTGTFIIFRTVTSSKH